jgi:hypothetical protein
VRIPLARFRRMAAMARAFAATRAARPAAEPPAPAPDQAARRYYTGRTGNTISRARDHRRDLMRAHVALGGHDSRRQWIRIRKASRRAATAP